jgi:serpin B
MKQKGTFNFYPSEELSAHVVEFPYVGEDISMMVILPPFDDKVSIFSLSVFF